MTDEQKFFFDLRGWLLLPAVLSEGQAREVRDHLKAGGNGFTGPAQELVDHPAVWPILNEILSDAEPADDYYNFRCENSFTTIRQYGWKPGPTERPHTVRPPHQATEVRYQCEGGRIYSGLTRVVWELNPVTRGTGGTLFLSGSHKCKFPHHPVVLESDNPHMETYECPAGSVLIFTESLLHASTPWTNRDVERVAIFNCYNSLWAQWHRLNLPHEQIMQMPEKRRTLFRAVYAHDFTARPVETGGNLYYSENSRSV
jgi:hypothetical protein